MQNFFTQIFCSAIATQKTSDIPERYSPIYTQIAEIFISLIRLPGAEWV